MLLKHILENFKAPIPPAKISTKRISGQAIKYIAWSDLADILDARAGLGNWSWSIVNTIETSPVTQAQMVHEGQPFTKSIKARLIITGRLTLHGDDRSISFDATGEELLDCSNFGDPASNASAQALRRACGLAGLGRTLWQDTRK